jgi:hypothetical protein
MSWPSCRQTPPPPLVSYSKLVPCPIFFRIPPLVQHPSTSRRWAAARRARSFSRSNTQMSDGRHESQSMLDDFATRRDALRNEESAAEVSCRFVMLFCMAGGRGIR